MINRENKMSGIHSEANDLAMQIPDLWFVSRPTKKVFIFADNLKDQSM